MGIFIVVLMAFFAIGIVSAEELNSSYNLTVDDNQNILKIDNQSNDLVKNNQSSISSEPSKEVKIKTKVKTSNIHSHPYKKSKYYKIKITDKKTKKPIKYLKIKVKAVDALSNKKIKTYSLKTNKKGIVKFNLKNLKIGSIWFDISSNDQRYDVKGYGDVLIGKLKKPVTIKMNKQIKLKNGDTLSTFYLKKSDGMFKKGVNVAGDDADNKYVMCIYKAKFFFKNNKNGKIISKISYNGNVNLIKGYTPIKTKVWYLED